MWFGRSATPAYLKVGGLTVWNLCGSGGSRLATGCGHLEEALKETGKSLGAIGFLWKAMSLARPYWFRLGLGVTCGFVAGLTNPMLIVSIKLVVDVAFSQQAAPAFTADRITDLPVLVARLKQPADAVSVYLQSRFSDETRRLLTAFPGPPADPEPLRQALVQELNRIMGGELIYTEERFRGVTLSRETQRLLGKKRLGSALPRLNKLLLEDALPGGIGTGPKPGSTGVSGQLQRAPGLMRQVLLRAGKLVASEHGPASSALMVLVILLVPLAMLLRGVFTYFNVYLMNWVSVRAVSDLRVKLFEHLLSLSPGFFNRTSTGELMSRFHEVNALQNVISNSLVTIIKEPVTIFSLAALLFSQQPKITAVTMALLPFTLLPFIFYRRKVRKSSSKIYQQQASISTMLHETLTGYRIVKAYNLEARMLESFRHASRAAISAFMRVLRSAELPGPMIEFFAALGVAGFFLYIAFSAEPETPSDLVQFVGAIFLMYAPIKAILRLHTHLVQSNAATQPIFALLDTQPTVLEPAQPKPLQAAGAPIVFEDVHFGYGERKVLKNINLTVKPGQMVALVGSSGAGKTTLTNLLLRFYDPRRGVIRIGGTNIRDVSTRELRSQIAVVTQETILFNDTIRNNIALGRPGATAEEIYAAARHAHAHDFIQEKAKGYDTVVGEKGIQLSGGQRQRIAIARAILKNAPILVLDEATNALDTESERAVQAALEELMKRRTTFCIAHRLSTIQRADLIVVLSQGQIVEMDRHEDLLRQGGHYQRLYELQFQ
jgi:ATP-binding cassette, subfamily B, bacterial MsbA